MPWYRAGSVAVTNGSAIVTGAGTDFVSNVNIGDGFVAPDRGVYEIAQVVSATQFLLATPYQGATAGGQGYSIKPTHSFARDLALAGLELLNTFGAVRDGAGQGMYSPGSLALPGLRATIDQDTGLLWQGGNLLSLVSGAAEYLRAGGGYVTSLVPFSAQDGVSAVRSGAVGSIVTPLEVVANVAGTATARMKFATVANMSQNSFIEAQTYSGDTSDLRFGAGGVERMRIDGAGNLLVGTSTGASFGGAHRITKIGEGATILSIDNGNANSVYTTVFIGVNGGGYSTAASAQWIGKHSVTERSINAGGTGNFTGSDYAEYMVKSATCGLIAKGDVCGVDRDGKLTKTWSDAVSFVIKSTDPSLVGGDTWAARLPPKPEQPGAEPQPPTFPALPPDDTNEASIAAWMEAQAAYPALLAAFQTEHAAWQQADAAYAGDLAAWEDELETARQCVDRIAFCGQVPCNVTGDFEVGDYIIAAANGAGIKAIAVKPDAITLPQYMRRIGKVWAIRDGRAWIDVQHG